MLLSRKLLYLSGIFAASLTITSYAADQQAAPLKQAPMPHQRQTLPPTVEQSQYNLPPTTKPRYDLLPRQQRNSVRAQLVTPDCSDMDKLATYSGAALADYLVGLP